MLLMKKMFTYQKQPFSRKNHPLKPNNKQLTKLASQNGAGFASNITCKAKRN